MKIQFELIQNINFFQEIGIGLHRRTYQAGESGFCIKIPHPNQFSPIILYLMETECLMYQISEHWGFEAVPATDVLLPGSKMLKEISSSFKKHLPNAPISYPILIQKYIPEANVEIDISHAQKVVIFNWITGRQDRTQKNSISNKEGKIFEIDNELTFTHILQPCNPHWLLGNEKVALTPLKNAFVEEILNLPEDLELNLMRIPNKGSKDGTELQLVENQVIKNLKILKRIIQNQSSIITLDSLQKIFEMKDDFNKK